jgi:hypothetical protein
MIRTVSGYASSSAAIIAYLAADMKVFGIALLLAEAGELHPRGCLRSMSRCQWYDALLNE